MFLSLPTAFVILASIIPALAQENLRGPRKIFVDVANVFVTSARPQPPAPTLIFAINDDGWVNESNAITFQWEEDLPNSGGSRVQRDTRCHFVGKMRDNMQGQDMWWQLRPIRDYVIPCGDSNTGDAPGSGIQLWCEDYNPSNGQLTGRGGSCTGGLASAW